MTVEEIIAALREIIDSAEGRALTEEESERYEELEGKLQAAKKDQEIRARQSAYETRATPALVVTPEGGKQEDTLERAFEHYLRTGMANADITELRAQATTPDSEGGYLVPPGFRQKLVEVQKAYGGLAAEVDSFSTDTGATIEYPSLDDTANEGSITAEEAAFADGDDLVFGTVNLGAFKYTSSGAGTTTPLRVSVELLQDSAFDIQGLVSRALGTRIARKQAVHWCVGVGTTEPFGIAHAGLTPDVSLATDGALTYQKLLDVEAELDPAYEQSAKWVMNKGAWTAIRGLLDGAERPIILDQAVSGIAGRPEKTLLGYPVVIDQAMPDYDADEAFFAVLGDLREAYVIRRVSNLVVVVNPYTRMNNGQVEYVAWERADGNIQNRSAYKVLANFDTP